MSIFKQAKDQLIRIVFHGTVVPSGLSELNHYFRIYDPIQFRFERQEDGSYIAISKNFRYGSIITQASDLNALDEKIKDAILTAFEVPSSYAQEADVRKVAKEKYAFA